MTDHERPVSDEPPLHRPSNPTVVRPRTIEALGAPDPVAAPASPVAASTAVPMARKIARPVTSPIEAPVEAPVETAVEAPVETAVEPAIEAPVETPVPTTPPSTSDASWTPPTGPIPTIAAVVGSEASAPDARRIAPPVTSPSDASWRPPTEPISTVGADDPPTEPDPISPVTVDDPEAAPEPISTVAVDDLEADPDVWVLDGEVDAEPELAPDGAVITTAVNTGEVEGLVEGQASMADLPPGAPARQGLLRANLLVASGTAVSRLTGLVRTSLILLVLVEGLNDAYNGANNTPNMIYELILGGILTAALVPLFTDDIERGDGQEGTSAIISFALVALVIVSLLALVVGPLLIHLFATGAPEANSDAYLSVGVPLALIFAPQVFFYGLMAVWSAVLNSRHRFMAAAWAPVLNNLIAIATLLVAAQVAGRNPTLTGAVDDPKIIWILGVGTTLGIAVMALSLYPAVRRAGVRLRFKVRLRHPAVQRAIRLSGWTFGYVVANLIAVIVIQILAKPSTGDPTRYTVAFQWFQLPHALLAVSIMVTFEPLLGRADSRGDRKGFNDQLLLGFRLIGLLIIPAAVGYIALPKGLDTRTFEATGDLGVVLGLTGIIAAFALGLPGFSTYLYALRGFYAMKNTKIPFFINCGENAINIVAAVFFARWWGVVGLALSFSLAYTVSAGVAVVVLARRSPGFDWGGLVQTWLKLLLAACVMGGFVYGVVALMAPASSLMLLPALVAGLIVGGLTYFAAIYALQVPGISELLARLPVLRRFA